MNSKKNRKPLPSPSTPPASEKRPPYKFLQRTLNIGNQDSAAYHIFHVKRFHIKKLNDPRQQAIYGTDYSLISKLFKNTKLIKTLQSAHVSSFLKPYVHENLKNLKHLKKYTFCLDNDRHPTKQIVLNLKNLLPPQVQDIRLKISIFGQFPARDLFQIARSLQKFPKLKSFHRDYSSLFERNRKTLPKELQIFNRSALRLKEMKRMNYDVIYGEGSNLQAVMKKGIQYPGIHRLKVDLGTQDLARYSQMRPFFREEKIGNDDEDDDYGYGDYYYHRYASAETSLETSQSDISNNSLEQDGSSIASLSSEEEMITEEQHQANCFMTEELKPFYRYELFPNLKELNLSQFRHLYPLGPFVVDGFKALKNLESLKISFMERSQKTTYLFQAFLELPLLQNFSLKINFLRDEDWPVFEKFVKAQTNLQSFALNPFDHPNSKAHYLKTNASIEKVIQAFGNNHALRSLDLKSEYWSLEALSKGFAHLTMSNQLYSLTFQAADDTVTSKTKPWKKVEGLCKFIKNQKESLKEFQALLPMVLSPKIALQIMEAISKQVYLRDLHLELNFCIGETMKFLFSFYENTLQRGKSYMKRESIWFDDWKPNLAKYIKKLKNLESFTFKSDIIEEEGGNKWFVEMIQALPSLEKLKRLEILSYEEGRLEGQEEKIIKALLQLKSIKDIDINLWKDKGEETSSHCEIGLELFDIREKQAIRSDLLF